jgi:hypothetical protein
MWPRPGKLLQDGPVGMAGEVDGTEAAGARRGHQGHDRWSSTKPGHGTVRVTPNRWIAWTWL